MFCASNLNDHVRTVVVWQDLWRVLKVIDWRLRSTWCASSSPILTTQRPLGFHVTQCFGCYASRILLVLLNQLSSCCHLVLACPCAILQPFATHKPTQPTRLCSTVELAMFGFGQDWQCPKPSCRTVNFKKRPWVVFEIPILKRKTYDRYS